MSHELLPYAYFEGKMVPVAEATVSIATHGLQYGTSTFSGMRTLTEDGNVLIFRLEDHAKRLARGAQLLNGKMEVDDIAKAILEFVKKNAPEHPIYIRPFVYCAGGHPVPALHYTEKQLAIYGLEFGAYLGDTGASMTFSSFPRVPDICLPARGKIGGAYWTQLSQDRSPTPRLRRRNHAQPPRQGSRRLRHEHLPCKRWHPLHPRLDPGHPRRHHPRQHPEDCPQPRHPDPRAGRDRSELLFADEVFLTGTAAGVHPVRRIESHDLPTTRPVTKQLQDAFQQAIRGKLPKFEHWVTSVRVDARAH